ncbi:MAG: hypothetical protein K8S13_01535 [Desulfobacula sp.]|nr:hypothetical protein [Desulfobacula sp.]
MMRSKRFLSLSFMVVIILFLVPGSGFAAEKMDKVILTTPFSPLAMPMWQQAAARDSQTQGLLHSPMS